MGRLIYGFLYLLVIGDKIIYITSDRVSNNVGSQNYFVHECKQARYNDHLDTKHDGLLMNGMNISQDASMNFSSQILKDKHIITRKMNSFADELYS